MSPIFHLQWAKTQPRTNFLPCRARRLRLRQLRRAVSIHCNSPRAVFMEWGAKLRPADRDYREQLNNLLQTGVLGLSRRRLLRDRFEARGAVRQDRGRLDLATVFTKVRTTTREIMPIWVSKLGFESGGTWLRNKRLRRTASTSKPLRLQVPRPLPTSPGVHPLSGRSGCR